jgi:hypothetical protein
MEDSQKEFEPKDIPWENLPKKTREFSGFMYLVMDAAMESMSETMIPNYIRCCRKGCKGIIDTSFDFEAEKINWRCIKCVN